MIYRNSIVALLVWFSLSLSINAQQVNQRSTVDSLSRVSQVNSQSTPFAVIHTDSFYEPGRGISRIVTAIKKLDQEFQSRKTELQRLRQRAEQLSSEIDSSAVGFTTPSQAKIDELEQLKKDLQREAEDTQTDYTKRMRDVIGPILEDLDKAIRTFAQNRGIFLIFDTSQLDEGILFLNESLDLTRSFITEFNRLHPGT